MEFRSIESVNGAWKIIPRKFEDPRGYFMRSYDKPLFAKHDLQTEWPQENQSENYRKGILRGLHFQAPPNTETKLVRAVVGRVQDVFVDIRKGSPTFGQYGSVVLDSEIQNMVYIPKGCAHAYLTLTEHSIVAYKVDAAYAPQSEGGLIWNDPKLAIPWQLEGKPLLSEKDTKWPSWSEFETPFV